MPSRPQRRYSILATGEVQISISRDEHQHPEVDIQPKTKTMKAISQATKDKITELERLGTRPKRILIELREGGLDIPTTTQLANFLKSYRRKQDECIKQCLRNRK
jgi:hypothetical protein